MTPINSDPARSDSANATLGDADAVGARPYQHVAADLGVDRQAVQAREEERFGGIKFGSAFFGWLTAAGVAALLMSLLAATGVALSLASDTSTGDITSQATEATGAARTVGLVGGIALLVVLFIAYFCGGYVAGRMARFNGTKQGLAVWIWGIVVAVVVAILVAVFGAKYNVLSNLNLPRIPVDEGSVTTAGIIAIVAIVVVTLGAALLGGKAGMHFHRKVDKAGLGA
ncbi:hypothetical protein [Nakamurella flava]|uniref:hypothetical protein n=1 Tax=Nakamurella flava TaxID=2576308 RepID=UPI0014099A92|nr:hypothetical protein [Nakamurella flava]